MFIIVSALTTLSVVFVIIVIFGLLVCLHEFGHFIAARRAGVLVEEFGFGMPPRLIGIQRIGKKWRIVKGSKVPTQIEHTIYSLNALPIGGFVKLYGDGTGGEGGEVMPKLAHRSFDNASVWWRAFVMVAGVAMNILLAVVIYYILLANNGFVSDQLPLIGEPKFAFGTVEKSIGIAAVLKDSPAEVAGLKSEDIVIEVRPHTKENRWLPVSKPTDLITIVKANDGVPVDVHVKDYTSGEERVVTVKPIYNTKEKRAMIGTSLMDLVTIHYDKPQERLFAGWLHSWNMGSYNVQAIGSIFSIAVSEKNPKIIGDVVSGPVGIGRVIDKILKSSGTRTFENLLNLTALISISLAFINILPLPALDGGRVLFLLPEMLFRRKINRKFEQYVNYVGFFILIGLSILIAIKDIVGLW